MVKMLIFRLWGFSRVEKCRNVRKIVRKVSPCCVTRGSEPGQWALQGGFSTVFRNIVKKSWCYLVVGGGVNNFTILCCRQIGNWAGKSGKIGLPASQYGGHGSIF